MKITTSSFFVGFFACFTISTAIGQTTVPIVQVNSIKSYPIEISFSKTSNIIFPKNIIGVDRGSKDVLIQKAKGVENILQLKAAVENFPETNVSVITSDGVLHSFIVSYAKNPKNLNLVLNSVPVNSATSFSSPFKNNEGKMERYAELAAASKERIKGIWRKTGDVTLTMNGIFIHDGIFYFRFNVKNRSNVGYDVDQLRFFIRDQKKAKRTAIQELEVKPLLISPPFSGVSGSDERTFVVAMTKFTIPDKKYLAVQMMEKNGGRSFEIYLRNVTVVKAENL